MRRLDYPALALEAALASGRTVAVFTPAGTTVRKRHRSGLTVITPVPQQRLTGRTPTLLIIDDVPAP